MDVPRRSATLRFDVLEKLFIEFKQNQFEKRKIWGVLLFGVLVIYSDWPRKFIKFLDNLWIVSSRVHWLGIIRSAVMSL